MKPNINILLIALLSSTVFLCGTPVSLAAPTDSKTAGDDAGLFSADFNKEQTEITSDSLTLKAKKRLFVYTGNVHVTQGDLTITSDLLEGAYDINNKIQKLVAKKNVKITKGEGIKANSEKAVYVNKTETLELTENPSIDQDGSLLTADLIRIFLKEDRSEAEGTVRVRLKDSTDPQTKQEKAPGKEKKKDKKAEKELS